VCNGYIKFNCKIHSTHGNMNLCQTITDKTIKERVKPPHLCDCRFNSKPQRKTPGYTGGPFIETLTMMHGNNMDTEISPAQQMKW